MPANPPKFLDHHVPTPEYALVPDCLCAQCSAVRRAWADARAARDALVYGAGVVGASLPDVADIAPEPPLLGPALVWRDVTCPGCRRLFCKVLTLPDVKLIPHCEGCALEGR